MPTTIFSTTILSKAENYLLEGVQIAENDPLVDPLLIMYNTLATVKAAQYDFKSVGMYGLKSDSFCANTTRKRFIGIRTGPGRPGTKRKKKTTS